MKASPDFVLGVRVGVGAVLLLWVLWDTIVDPPNGSDVWHDPALFVYRGMGNLIFLLWLGIASVHGWRACGLQWEAIFGMDEASAALCDPTRNPALVADASDLTLAFIASFLCFYKAIRGVFLSAVSPGLAHCFPLLLVLYVCYKICTPAARAKRLATALVRVVSAPFGPAVTFADGFVGDVLTSLARVLVDIAFSVLFYLAGIHGFAADKNHLFDDRISGSWYFRCAVVPALTASPLWWRFCQNIQRARETGDRWPHIANALKYASAQTVTLWGVWHPELHASGLWIAAFVLATLYQFVWDVTMDWGLVELAEAGPRLRRRRLVLGGDSRVYYAVCAANLLLRFGWTLSLLPERGGRFFMPELQLRLSPVIAAAELARRAAWAVFRLEKEQIDGSAPGDGAAEAAEAAAAEAPEGEVLLGAEWHKMDVGGGPAGAGRGLLAAAASAGRGYFGARPASSGAFAMELGALAALVALGAASAAF